MTPDLTADSIAEPIKQPPSTAGLTTKVVKGSMWTLGGSVLPLAVSFISTPFIIRFLGTESYGVLLLVGLIPTYFSFADFGMSIASTKFASEAYGQGDEKKEAEVVWTATAIAAVSSFIVAVPLFLFSYSIMQALNVPEHLLSQASIGLKITSGSFFLGILASVLNSPMLARLRMDMNMLTSAIPKILLAAVTPFILYFGGHIVEAIGWIFVVTLGTLAVVAYFSARLLPELFKSTFNREMLKPLLGFGRGWLMASVAAMLIVNLDKFFVSKLESVKALAFYSVAFTFANIASFFSSAMIQSLVPAFSRIQGPENKEEFNDLFSRMIRLTLVWVFPALALMFVVANPFFSIWAGEDFGRESTIPFYILLVGLFFNVLSYVPNCAITSRGHVSMLGKLYSFELVFYSIILFFLISYFSITGAAIAWSLRAAIDILLVGSLVLRVERVQLQYWPIVKHLLAGIMAFSPTVFYLIFVDNYSPWLFFFIPFSLVIYALALWRFVLPDEELKWIHGKARNCADYFAFWRI